ncbi:MAG: DUF475 domain-containing protein [Candidatus Kerfeldbacteria bacterium]|nr:DUF475 domain-containing protein [Candidatus Kerfeldbacteria bacterium]
MPYAELLVTIAGLALFETVSSLDNAIINAEVLGTMAARARRWFLTWGFFIAVVLVRGALPWLIVWLTSSGLGPWQAFIATFSRDPQVISALERAAPVLLISGGTFLLLLFVHWLFMEEKHYGLPGERLVHRLGAWFYSIASFIVLGLALVTMHRDVTLVIGTLVGSTAFFITHGFKSYAEEQEAGMSSSGMNDVAKLLYLEVIDATFSVDGVLGAFAFTLAVPIILLGNGLGAFVVRQLTVRNISRIKELKYIKNGAMYSIFCLGVIMVADALGIHTSTWLSPVATFIVISFFLWKSLIERRQPSPTT